MPNEASSSWHRRGGGASWVREGGGGGGGGARGVCLAWVGDINLHLMNTFLWCVEKEMEEVLVLVIAFN